MPTVPFAVYFLKAFSDTIFHCKVNRYRLCVYVFKVRVSSVTYIGLFLFFHTCSVQFPQFGMCLKLHKVNFILPDSVDFQKTTIR